MIRLLLQDVALTGFAGVMAAAAVEDFRRFVIPNALSLAICLLWLLRLAAAPSLLGAVAAIGCALAVFAVGAVFFARGYLGGGDVKLLSAATLWVGPAAAPSLLALTALCGGVLALFLMMPVAGQLVLGGRALLRGAPPAGGGDERAHVPYGVAIAVAALIVTIPPHFT